MGSAPLRHNPTTPGSPYPVRPHPRPLKQVYPCKPTRRASVTIAAGFMAIDGVLICADTLYTDGYTKVYLDKIFTQELRHAVVVFGLAGNAATGGTAIEDC